MEEMENYKVWINRHGLSRNPFTLDINPSLMVGYRPQLAKLLKNIEQQQKILLLTGPTGSGKTSTISYLVSEKSNFILLNKPPRDLNGLINISDIFIKDLPFFVRIFKRKPKTIEEVPEFLNKTIKTHKVLFVDEAHEAGIEVLEWFRVLSDQVNNLTIVFSALPVFDDILIKNLETLKKRIVEKIELNALTKEETEELIRKRIASVGGTDIKPFSYNAVNHIYSRTGGFPRDVIMMCSKLLDRGAEVNADYITPDLIDYKSKDKHRREDTSISISKFKDLSAKQRKIIDSLLNTESMNPNELVKLFPNYPSEKHGLRAINNLLKRLVDEGYIEREKVGKTYKYKITPSTRTILIRA